MRKIKFETGKFYHIYNRGANKEAIFYDESDRWRFLQALFLFNDSESSGRILYEVERENKGRINFNLLKKFVEKNKKDKKPLVKIMADCLMANHFHFIVQQVQENGISSFMHKLGTGFTSYINKKYKKSGSLFQGPYKAIEIENEEYLKHVLVYINVLNPGQLIEPDLKENGVKNIESILKISEDYIWSTSKEYLGKRNSFIIDKGILGNIFSTPGKYKEFVKEILLNKKLGSVSHLLLE